MLITLIFLERCVRTVEIFYSKAAKSQNRSITTTDTVKQRTFNPDGSIDVEDIVEGNK